jgi:hypothetical protein
MTEAARRQMPAPITSPSVRTRILNGPEPKQRRKDIDSTVSCVSPACSCCIDASQSQREYHKERNAGKGPEGAFAEP